MEVFLSHCTICGDCSLTFCGAIFCINYLELLSLKDIYTGCSSVFKGNIHECVNLQPWLMSAQVLILSLMPTEMKGSQIKMTKPVGGSSGTTLHLGWVAWLCRTRGQQGLPGPHLGFRNWRSFLTGDLACIFFPDVSLSPFMRIILGKQKERKKQSRASAIACVISHSDCRIC